MLIECLLLCAGHSSRCWGNTRQPCGGGKHRPAKGAGVKTLEARAQDKGQHGRTADGSTEPGWGSVPAVVRTRAYSLVSGKLLKDVKQGSGWSAVHFQRSLCKGKKVILCGGEGVTGIPPRIEYVASKEDLLPVSCICSPGNEI